MNSLNRRVFTVGQLNRYVKSVLEGDVLLSGVFIEGEVSNFKLHTSGHMYFTLKDAYAAVNCVMFRGHAEGLRFRPENGMRLVACGRVSLYERSGQYQFYAEDMEPWGQGGLYAAFEQMKAKLSEEGLFDGARKRPLPAYPRAVAVVTSLTGAAVRDIITVARRRNRAVRLVIAPALVQGRGAAASIVSAISLINEFAAGGSEDEDIRPEIIILARGGGSIEDLWPFNEEAVARAVYASALPVVSAVGHETDYCITDFVADMRAPTPSAAAEMCVPAAGDVKRALDAAWRRADSAAGQRLVQGRGAVERLAAKTSPRAFLEAVYSRQIYAEQLFDKLSRDMLHKTQIARLRLSKLAGGIELAAPPSVLRRGYSLVYGRGGLKISAGQFEAGEGIELRFHDGAVKAEVKLNYNEG